MISYAASLIILLASVIEVHASFEGVQKRRLSPSFLEVALESDPHHDSHHGHDDHHDSHGHGDEHDSHGHGGHHDSHGSHPGEKGRAVGELGKIDEGNTNSVAIGLIAWITLNPLVIYMALTPAAGGQISFLTLKLIDISMSIFLAVLWFSAAGDVLKSDSLEQLFPHAAEVFAVVQVLVLYILTMIIAYHFRDNKYYLLAFCGIAGHYVAFAAIKAAGEGQRTAGHFSPYMSLAFCLVVLVICIVMSLICFYSWRMYIKNDELHFAIDELELDIIGLTLSFAIIQAVRHMLTGHYPEAHLLLQDSDDRDYDIGHGHHHHTESQRLTMLACAFGFTVLAGLSLCSLEAIKERTHYWMHKALHIVQVVLVMCAAWGYLLWGQWQFYETSYQGDPMFGNMVFAIMVTIISLLIIIALAFADERFVTARAYGNLCVMAVSLVCAWSWEHCFHVAINVIAEDYSVGYGGLVPKIFIAILVPVMILPGYLLYIKPVICEKDEIFNAEEREELSNDLSEVVSSTVSPIKPASEIATPAKEDEAW